MLQSTRILYPVVKLKTSAAAKLLLKRMDYPMISDYLQEWRRQLTIINMARWALVKKAGWSAEDELRADELDYHRERLEDMIEEAADALSQCD